MPIFEKSGPTLYYQFLLVEIRKSRGDRRNVRHFLQCAAGYRQRDVRRARNG